MKNGEAKEAQERANADATTLAAKQDAGTTSAEIVLPELPRLSGFSGDLTNTSFGRWARDYARAAVMADRLAALAASAQATQATPEPAENPPLGDHQRMALAVATAQATQAVEPVAWHVEWVMPTDKADRARWVKLCANEKDALDYKARYPETVITPLVPAPTTAQEAEPAPKPITAAVADAASSSSAGGA